MKDKRAFQVLMVMVAAGVILLGLVTTRSYILTLLSNDNEDTSASIATRENLVLSYTDCASTKVEDCANIEAELAPGDSIEKTFRIRNDSPYDQIYKVYFQELYNTFKNDDLVYKVEDLDTGEILVEEIPVPYYSDYKGINQIAVEDRIGKDEAQELKLTVTFLNRDYSQNENLNAEFSFKLTIEKTETAVEKIIASAKSGDPTFVSAATTDEGVYAMADDYGTSYYYRGAVTNNYVNFAGFYWRIIRINGDGSVRMIYDGTQAYANGTSDTARSALTDQMWNANYNDAKYIGYMFGGIDGEASTSKEQAQTNTTSSDVKEKLDAWYKTNIEDKGYSKYLADVIFCNDRSTASTANTWWTNDTAKGFGTDITAYGAWNRFLDSSGNASTSPVPRFTCPNLSTDGLTVDATTDNKGNGALDYPVGMITADEIVAAGSGKTFTNNTSYYLYKGHWYWSLSPYGMDTDGYAGVFRVDNGGLNNNYVGSSGAVAPVINISAETAATLVGDGTIGNEYRLPTT